MGMVASQITSLTIVYSTVYSDTDQRKYQSSASLVFVRGIHRGPVNSPHKWPVTRKIFPFDDVIMIFFKVNSLTLEQSYHCPKSSEAILKNIGKDTPRILRVTLTKQNKTMCIYYGMYGSTINCIGIRKCTYQTGITPCSDVLLYMDIVVVLLQALVLESVWNWNCNHFLFLSIYSSVNSLIIRPGDAYNTLF